MTANLPVIDILKTDVETPEQAAALVRLVEAQFPGVRANVDLHDTDKILRLEGTTLNIAAIIPLVQSAGFYCRPLD